MACRVFYFQRTVLLASLKQRLPYEGSVNKNLLLWFHPFQEHQKLEAAIAGLQRRHENEVSDLQAAADRLKAVGEEGLQWASQSYF